MSRKKIVFKIGGALNVLNGVPNLPFIETIVQQITGLSDNFYFLLVLSGAIPVGISISQDKKIDRSDVGKALYSMMGQAELFEAYINTFRKYGLKAGSGNYTTKTLQNKFTGNVFNKAYQKKFIILANEADNVNPEEIEGDNDPLAAKIAIITQADYLILLTTANDGIICNLPSQDGLYCEKGVIKKISSKLITKKFLNQIDTGKTSRQDSNGIKIKLTSGKMACKKGIQKAIIADGKEKNILLKLLLKNKNIGTTIVP